MSPRSRQQGASSYPKQMPLLNTRHDARVPRRRVNPQTYVVRVSLADEMIWDPPPEETVVPHLRGHFLLG